MAYLEYRIKVRWQTQFYLYALYISCCDSEKSLTSVYIYGSYRKIKTRVSLRCSAGSIKIMVSCTQYFVKSIRESRRRMKLAFDMRVGLIGIFSKAVAGWWRQSLGGRMDGQTDGRWRRQPSRGPSSRVNYKLVVVAWFSDVRSDETVGRAHGSNLLQIQLWRAASFASHLSSMMNWPVSTHYGARARR